MVTVRKVRYVVHQPTYMQAAPKSAVSAYYICATIPYVFSHINSVRTQLCFCWF